MSCGRVRDHCCKRNLLRHFPEGVLLRQSAGKKIAMAGSYHPCILLCPAYQRSSGACRVCAASVTLTFLYVQILKFETGCHDMNRTRHLRPSPRSPSTLAWKLRTEPQPTWIFPTKLLLWDVSRRNLKPQSEDKAHS